MIARVAVVGLHLLLVVGVTFACAGGAGGAGWTRALLILPALLSLAPLPLAMLADVKGNAKQAKTLLLSVALSLPVSIVLLLVLLLSRRLDNAGWH
ncbi:hypothetical protein INH39_14230 [Massilia violaceinigra]|uniref:Uncharacterized protein n=1 Tax=Massilia violaceinigra TaxID=2045208 RepID=A0ABY4AFL9_9BURK|nr:hypothetical protein [Massilia violaceinigra]UOD32709.1 hypothetical protein INH39_14230 [Massilia violaceinigra]